MIELLYCNPWRPVDAWWQRAVGIMEREEPAASPNRDGGRGCGWIKRAQRFQAALREADSPYEQMQLIIDFPGVYYAHQLFTDESAAGRTTRWAIEARILARQTDDEIAQAGACRPDVIEAYEALFFNVRDRLDYRDVILNHVLGCLQVRSWETLEVGWLWKLFAYLGGPHVLESLMSRLPGTAWVHEAGGIAAFFQDTAIGSMKLKAALAAAGVRVDGRTQLALLEAFTKYIEIERTTGSAGQASDQIQENLQAMLEEMPFKAIGVQSEKQVPAFDRGAAELRADELMQVAAGLPVPGLDGVRDLRFPELAPR